LFDSSASVWFISTWAAWHPVTPPDTSYVEKNNLKFGRKIYIRISLIEGCC
jgi:hypothetical protein